MAILVVLWSYLLTTKLSCLQKNNIGHTNVDADVNKKSASGSKTTVARKGIQYRFKITLKRNRRKSGVYCEFSKTDSASTNTIHTVGKSALGEYIV